MSQLSPTATASHASIDASARVDEVPTLLQDLMTLTKMRITLMVALTAFVGFAFGVYDTDMPWSALTLLGAFPGAMLGTAISCMGAAALNQAYEHDTDALMHRTRNRPLPAGRMNPFLATLLGVGLSCLGVMILLATTHWLAALLSAATILSYCYLYTPMKRTTSLALLVGTLPGAAPPLIGYAAATGTLGTPAWLAFAIMVVWQVPHFLAIAWLYREDYARSGMPMLPVIDTDGHRTFHQTLVGCLLLLPLGLMPTYLGVSGKLYFVVAMLAGLGFLALGVALSRNPSRARARALFLGSLLHMPLLLAMMLIDRV